MLHNTTTFRLSPFGATWPRAAWGAVLAAYVLLAAGAAADDRDILLESAGSPYLFVVFDTSSSLTNSPPCSREQALSDMNPFDAMCTSECPLETADCRQICPDRGCREYDFTSVSAPGDTPDFTRDNGNAGATDSGWPSNLGDLTAQGGDYLDDLGSPQCGDVVFYDLAGCDEVVYDPDVPDTDLSDRGAGYYMIFLWWPDAARNFATSMNRFIPMPKKNDRRGAN